MKHPVKSEFLAKDDQQLVELIGEHTRWGPRTSSEQRAFTASVMHRVVHRRAWFRPVAAAAALGAIALSVALLAPVVVEHDANVGQQFLIAAYDPDNSDEDEASARAYLPSDYKLWSEALDVGEDGLSGEPT